MSSRPKMTHFEEDIRVLSISGNCLARPSHLIARGAKGKGDGLAANRLVHTLSTNQILLAGIHAKSIHSLQSRLGILALMSRATELPQTMNTISRKSSQYLIVDRPSLVPSPPLPLTKWPRKDGLVSLGRILGLTIDLWSHQPK